MKIKLVALNARYIHSCPALFYVRQALQHHLVECEPELFQFTINDSYYGMLSRILAGKPEAVFFSVYIWNSGLVRRLVTDLGRAEPGLILVLGGPQAPFVFGAVGASSLQARVQYTVVMGEIEGVAPGFYDDLTANALQPEYGATNGPSFDLPYQKADFSGELANRYIYYESSRGCPFACAYCLSGGSHGARHKAPDQVKEELVLILAHHPRVLRFVDRTFNDRRGRALEIWQFLAQEAAGTMCHFEVAPDLFSEEIFTFLQGLPSGRFQFEIGIQSTNKEALKAVNRTMAVDAALANIKRLAGLDRLHIHVDLILGLPFETRETFAQSFDRVFACLPHYIQMGLLKVLPDTPLAARAEEFGLLSCGEPPHEVLANRWLTQPEMAELYWFGECVEAFFNNRFFRSLWRYILQRGESGFEFFNELLVVCQQHDFFELAPTQKLMDRMLREMVATRPDGLLLAELLTFDWLKSGQRLLPETVADESPARLKDRLWKKFPPNLAPLYDYVQRDEFFKRTIFKSFSGEMLKAAGLVDDNPPDFAHVAFLFEKEEGVFGVSRTVVLPEF